MFVTNIAFTVRTHLIIVALSKASCSPCTCWLMIYRRIRVLQLNRGLNGTMSTTLVIGAKSNLTPLLFTGSLSQAQSSLLYHLVPQPFSATVRYLLCTPYVALLRAGGMAGSTEQVRSQGQATSVGEWFSPIQVYVV